MKRKKRQIAKNNKRSLLEIISSDRKLTVPNFLTLIRLLAIPVVAYFVYIHNLYLAISFGIPIALTDALDGWVARKFNQKSELGRVLDPVADKALYIFVGLSMVLGGYLPLWFYVLVIGRDLIIMALALVLIRGGLGTVPESRNIGRFTFALILLTVLSFLLPGQMIFFYTDRIIVLGVVILKNFLVTVQLLQKMILVVTTFFIFLSLVDYGLFFLRRR